jgi:D-serine deaminase-like pyridoxal phosphate-dependent protein
MDSYELKNSAALSSPALLFYRDVIRRNIKKAVSIAGDVRRLRPHVKTHKTKEITLMAMELGISKFKCATIAEAEMLAMAEAPDVLLAYPLVGPNIERFLALAERYPATRLTAVVDHPAALADLSRAAARRGAAVDVMLDLDPGMHRTGVSFGDEALELYGMIGAAPALRAAGLHCYDGHIHQSDLGERSEAARTCCAETLALRRTLEKRGLPVPAVVMGGTPTFPVYAAMPEVELSPGTFFLHDWGYSSQFPDLPFEPAALILSRVVSVHPRESSFTLDLGHKALAADPAGRRGVLFGADAPDAAPLFQNEEHWVWKVEKGGLPETGREFLVLPTHICPTVALHAEAAVVDGDGGIVSTWPIVSRNRRLTI